MGLMDRIRQWGSRDGGREAAPIERSPLELQLIEQMQDTIGDPLRQQAPIRLRLLFSGEVQGVGFRWNSTAIARELDVTGWVCNLDDGTVIMEAQGAPRQIIQLLDRIHAYYQRFRNRIWLERADGCATVADDGRFEARYEPGIDL